MEQTFDLCGGHLALDFVNILGDQGAGQASEPRADYRALLAFAVQTGIVSAAAADRLRRSLAGDPGRAAAAVGEAVRLRGALFDLFDAVVRGAAPPEGALAVLDEGLARLRISAALALSWGAPDDDPAGFLGAVVAAAVTLLTDPEARGRVRSCEAPDCAWLFLDASRNRSRRWCDMRQCGNRMKARRHQARRRGGAQGGADQKV